MLLRPVSLLPLRRRHGRLAVCLARLLQFQQGLARPLLCGLVGLHADDQVGLEPVKRVDDGGGELLHVHILVFLHGVSFAAVQCPAAGRLEGRRMANV